MCLCFSLVAEYVNCLQRNGNFALWLQQTSKHLLSSTNLKEKEHQMNPGSLGNVFDVSRVFHSLPCLMYLLLHLYLKMVT